MMSEAETISETEREELLHLAARRSMIYREVVRHAAQQLRSTLAHDCSPAEAKHSARRSSRSAFGESQFRILRCLVEEGSLTVSQLAEACRVSVPAVSRMLNHLDAQGWIERRTDATNRRIVQVVATDAGREAEAMMIRRFTTALEGVLSPLSNHQLEDLVTAFGHLERLLPTEASERVSSDR